MIIGLKPHRISITPLLCCHRRINGLNSRRCRSSSLRLLSFGPSSSVLKPVINIFLHDLSVLRQLQRDLFNPLWFWCSASFLVNSFKNLKLHRCWCPTMPMRYFINAWRSHHRIKVSASCWIHS